MVTSGRLQLQKVLRAHWPFGLLFLFFTILYTITMLPGQAFHDAGEFQTIIKTVQIAHPTGYPTYILIGKIATLLLPFVSPARVANGLSVLYSLGSLLLLYALSFRLTRNCIASLIGPLFWGLCLPFWYYSGVADPHTLHRTILLGLIFLFWTATTKKTLWSFALFGLLLGLGIGNHLFLVYVLPGFVVWVGLLLLTKKLKLTYQTMVNFILAGLTAVIGASVYVLLPIVGFEGNIENATRTLRTFAEFRAHVLGSDFQGLMFAEGIQKSIANIFSAARESITLMTPLAAILGLVGVVDAQRKHRIETLALVVMMLSMLAFAANYPTSDARRYYLPIMGLWLLFAGNGVMFIDRLTTYLIRSRWIRFGVLALGYGVLFFAATQQLTTNYERADKSKDTSAAQYATSVFASLPPNSVLLVWWHYYTPLWYQQKVLQTRTDVLILNNSHWSQSIKEYIRQRPVYVIEDRPEIIQDWELVQQGPIYQVIQ